MMSRGVLTVKEVLVTRAVSFLESGIATDINSTLSTSHMQSYSCGGFRFEPRISVANMSKCLVFASIIYKATWMAT